MGNVQYYSGLFPSRFLFFNLILLSSVWDSSLCEENKNDELPTLYMTGNCRRIDMISNYWFEQAYVLVDQPVYLMVHPMQTILDTRAYINVNECFTTLRAPPRHQLLLHFLDISIGRNVTPLKNTRLYMYDGPNADVQHLLKPVNGIFGESKGEALAFSNIFVMDYVSFNQALSLYFNGYLNKRYYGFKAIVTPFIRPMNNSCPVGTFRCRHAGFCITENLMCDGRPNCGAQDNSDEGNQCLNKAASTQSLTNLDDLGLMIGCAVSILVLLMAVVWVGVMCRRSKRLRNQRHQLRDAAHRALAGGFVESSLWLPNSLTNHLPPWMVPGPPPAYSESPDNNDFPSFEPPPQYSAESYESRALIQSGDVVCDDHFLDSDQNIIRNVHALVATQMEQPPTYEEAASSRLSSLQPTAPAPQYMQYEPTQKAGDSSVCSPAGTVSQAECATTGAAILLENNFTVQNDHVCSSSQD